MPFATEAWSLFTYGCIELFNMNGPIGILAFGFALANLNLLPNMLGGLFNLKPVTENEMSLLKEISFLLRTFFFLYLGMLMKFSSLNLFILACLLTALMIATRYIAVRLVFSSKKFPVLDALVAVGMGAKRTSLRCAGHTAPAKRLCSRRVYSKSDFLYYFDLYYNNFSVCYFWPKKLFPKASPALF